MKKSRTIVLYDSNYGNTRKIAESIAGELKCEVESISDFCIDKLSDYDFLILGSPIIGWMPTVRMQDFLTKIKESNLDKLKATTFDTRVKLFIHGDAMQKMAKRLKDDGVEIVYDSMAFYVSNSKKEPKLLEGELNRAIKWAQKINK